MEVARHRVYVIVRDALGAVVARRYVGSESVPVWLKTTAGSDGVRCDVYDEAPDCGGRIVTTLIPRGRSWEQQ